MAEPLTPLLEWLCEEQADIAGKDLAKLSGIAPQTWSKVRQGKQDLSSDLLWRCMSAIALLRPHSECAKIIEVIGKKNSWQTPPPLLRIEQALDELNDEEISAAIMLIAKKLRKSDRTIVFR